MRKAHAVMTELVVVSHRVVVKYAVGCPILSEQFRDNALRVVRDAFTLIQIFNRNRVRIDDEDPIRSFMQHDLTSSLQAPGHHEPIRAIPEREQLTLGLPEVPGISA